MTDLATIFQSLAMPIVAAIGIAVAFYFSLRAHREEGRRREAEHVQANALRDAQLAQLKESQEKADAKFQEVHQAQLAQFRESQEKADAQFQEVRHAQAAQLRESQEKADAQFQEVRHAQAAQLRESQERADAQFQEVRHEMKELRSEFRSEVKGVRDDLKAHEEKCERRWQRLAEEFGEVRGLLSALLQQRTAEHTPPRLDR